MIGAYVGPKGLRELRTWAAQLRADLVSTTIKPGRFTTIERGLTFHIRERRANGQLIGLLIDDLRNPKERITFLAERGDILENDRGTYPGPVEPAACSGAKRQSAIPSIVHVRSLCLRSLATFRRRRQQNLITARERYLWELADPDPAERCSTACSRAPSAPSSTIGWWRRSIRWRSPSSPMRFSASRRPRARAGPSRSALPSCAVGGTAVRGVRSHDLCRAESFGDRAAVRLARRRLS